MSLLDVPEPKMVKNRMHIDIRAAHQGSPEQRWAQITKHATGRPRRGAPVLWMDDGRHVTMADPEDNEFDIC